MTFGESKKIKKTIAAAAGLIILACFCLIRPFAGMEAQGMRVLGSVLCAIAFWAGNVFPDWMTGLLLIAVWNVICGIPFKEAINGFTGESLWLVVCACCMAEAVERTGLFARISWGIIRLFHPSFRGISLALFAVGLVFAPLIPSATAKAVLGASLAYSLAEAMDYGPDSDGRCGLFIASFIGFSVSTVGFASGSVFTYTLRGVLPAEVNAQIGWGKWLLSSLPWLAITLGLCYAGIWMLYGRKAPSMLDPAHVDAEREKLGPVKRKEKVAGVLLAVCVVLWIFERRTGLSAATVSVAAFVLCFALGLLKPEDLKTSVPWGLFLYLGAVLNLGPLFSAYGINDLLELAMTPLITALHDPFLVILAVGLLTLAIRFLIVSQTATTVILMAVLLPIAPKTGVSPFILGFTILATQQSWFAAYQNTVFGPARACMHGTLSHGKTVKASFLYAGAALLACLVSIPYWKLFGYL
ncbi:MAG: anion permease [Clostridia bacterium]|nr:anion permease [Clostridia bacterium]